MAAKDFAWQGLLNADINLDIPASGPKGNIVIDASGGTLRVRDKGRWVDFPIRPCVSTARWRHGVSILAWRSVESAWAS